MSGAGASGLGFALIENSIYNIQFLAREDGAGALFAMGTYRALVNALALEVEWTREQLLELGLTEVDA